MDDLLAQALMSTKKATPVHRMTILGRLANASLENSHLLELCRLFQVWLQKEIENADESAFEDVWQAAVTLELVGPEHRDCFTQ